jgi:hypothetical protein
LINECNDKELLQQMVRERKEIKMRLSEGEYSQLDDLSNLI